MKILGINYLSESSVALIENGEVTYAISEERLNRIKNWWGNPFKAIKHVLKKTNNSISDIDIFSTHGIVSLNKSTSNHEVINRKIKEVQSSRLSLKNKKSQINFLNERYAHEKRALKRNAKNILSLKKNSKKIEIYDHHEAHAASAYFLFWME